MKGEINTFFELVHNSKIAKTLKVLLNCFKIAAIKIF